MLALPAIPSDYDYEAVVVCGLVIGQKPVIAAGRAFFGKYEQTPEEDEDDQKSDQQNNDEENDQEITRTSSERKKKKDQFSGNALRLSNLVRDLNLYSILGVSESCSGDDIKKSYRKLVLEKHPDKLKSLPQVEQDKCRNEFLQIQEAFEVLMDDKKRRMYDSSLPFDDSIPSEKDVNTETEFYIVFDAAFRRNERWSILRPVPSIGNEDSSRDAVEKFYSFWFNRFETWRDFSHHDEHDLSHAEYREERRWMEVQNMRIRKKKSAEEVARVRRLVDTAAKLDPRLKRWKADDAEAVAAEKRRRQAEREQRQRAEDEKRQVAEKRRIEVAMESEIEKERLKAEKAEIKRIRGEIRHFLGLNDETTTIDATRIEKFNSGLIGHLSTLEKATELLDRAKSVAGNLDEISSLIEEILVLTAPVSRTVSAPATPAEPESAISPGDDLTSTGWTEQEIMMLTRGMQKYPVGTNRRWEVIKSLIGGSRSVSDIIDMSKRVASQKVVEPTLMVGSRKKIETVTAPDVDYERVAKAPAPVVQTVTADEWSTEQQKQLEEAMRMYPATLPPAERWTKIAEVVEGKTKQQCVARFKYIRELIAKKK